MKVIRTQDFRNELKKYGELASAGEKILILRPHNENIMLISEREYSELERYRQVVTGQKNG